MACSQVIDAALGAEMDPTQGLALQSRSVPRKGSGGLARVLIVEPDSARRARLCDAVRTVADIESDEDFLSARAHLLSKPYDWLVTFNRLGEYNGLHLVYLAVASRKPMRFLVYADRGDIWLAPEAQHAGAFYESLDCVDRALPAYLRGALPPRDRRNPAEPDRRATVGHNRRCTDARP